MARTRRTREPWPLVEAGRIRPAPPVGAGKPGPGRQIVSQDSPSGVSRIGGQAGTQAPDPTPAPPQNRASRAGSTIHTLPAESVRLASASAALAPTRRWSNSARQPPQLAVSTDRREFMRCASRWSITQCGFFEEPRAAAQSACPGPRVRPWLGLGPPGGWPMAHGGPLSVGRAATARGGLAAARSAAAHVEDDGDLAHLDWRCVTPAETAWRGHTRSSLIAVRRVCGHVRLLVPEQAGYL